MRGIPVLITGVVASVGGFTRPTLGPPACYVANTAVIWHGDPDYSIRRIISTGIRRYEDSGAGAANHCVPKDSADLAANREALARVVDSMHLAPPLVTSRLEIAAQSAELVRSQIVSLEAKARSHPDNFSGLEIVDVRRPSGSSVPAAELPPLSKTVDRANWCRAANDSLGRLGSTIRMAC
jgi:hypothetical protein